MGKVKRFGDLAQNFGCLFRGKTLARQSLFEIWRGPIPEHLVHEFFSPEHLRDRQSITARSDQYSLAAIAYSMPHHLGRAGSTRDKNPASAAFIVTPYQNPALADLGFRLFVDLDYIIIFSGEFILLTLVFLLRPLKTGVI